LDLFIFNLSVGSAHDGHKHVHENNNLNESSKNDGQPDNPSILSLGVILPFKVEFTHPNQERRNEWINVRDISVSLNV